MKGLNGALMSFHVPVCFGVRGEENRTMYCTDLYCKYDLVIKQFG